jgi:hypothetical protein
MAKEAEYRFTRLIIHTDHDQTYDILDRLASDPPYGHYRIPERDDLANAIVALKDEMCRDFGVDVVPR